VETWLVPDNPWHIRIHRIVTPRALQTTEGGFAIEQADFHTDIAEQGEGFAVWRGQTDTSAIVDLSPAFSRQGHPMSPIANTNLIHAKTLLPQLRGQIATGTTLLAAAVIALPNTEMDPAFLQSIPTLPDIAELERLFRTTGNVVPAFDLAGIK
jgi:hypothetical protein